MDTSGKTKTSREENNRDSLLSPEILARFEASMEVGEDSLIETCKRLAAKRKAREEKEKKG